MIIYYVSGIPPKEFGLLPDGDYDCVECRNIPIETILEETVDKVLETDNNLCKQELERTRIKLERQILEEEYDKQIGPLEKQLKDKMKELKIVPCAYHGNIFTGKVTHTQKGEKLPS